MRVVAWNIQHGGGKRIPRIVQALADAKPDVVILAEFRRENSVEVSVELTNWGLKHHLEIPGVGRNGILLASRFALEKESPGLVKLQGHDVRIRPVYVPIQSTQVKAQAWQLLLEAASVDGAEPVLWVGDFNTGAAQDAEVGRFRNQADFESLGRLGLLDAWRHCNPGQQHYSWFSRTGNGFRIDHAFASATVLPRIRMVRYEQEPRIARVSDHALLIVDLV